MQDPKFHYHLKQYLTKEIKSKKIKMTSCLYRPWFGNSIEPKITTKLVTIIMPKKTYVSDN